MDYAIILAVGLMFGFVLGAMTAAIRMRPAENESVIEVFDPPPSAVEYIAYLREVGIAVDRRALTMHPLREKAERKGHVEIDASGVVVLTASGSRCLNRTAL